MVNANGTRFRDKRHKVSYLYEVKIKFSHVEQMTANHNVNGVHVKLQLGWTITHEPRKQKIFIDISQEI